MVWKRKRSVSNVFQRGDSKLWESACGNYRLRQVKGVAGVAVRAHWCALYRSRTGPDNAWTIWELLSRHKARKNAEAAVEKHARIAARLAVNKRPIRRKKGRT